MVANIFDKI